MKEGKLKGKVKKGREGNGSKKGKIEDKKEKKRKKGKE